MSATTPYSPDTEGYGNTIDGTRTGDGGEGRSPGKAASRPETRPETAPRNEREHQRLESDKRGYRTPDKQWDRAVGGSSGTTDGQ